MAEIPTQGDFDTAIPGEFFDSRGRFHGPAIERAADMTPVQVKLPSLPALKDYMKGMGPAAQADALLAISRRYGITKTIREMGSEVGTWLDQVHGIPPGSEQFRAEMRRILAPKTSNVDAARKQARYSMRKYQQVAAQNGDPNQSFVRIAEGDENTCEGPNGCARLDGHVGTMAEHQAVGAPGMQICGSNCRCTLMAVSSVGGMQGNWLADAGATVGILDGILAIA